jgi:anti-anti-sigma factor
MNHSFSTQIRPFDNLVIIDLMGEIDAFADQEIQSAYAQAESFNTPTIVLNFTQVGYINSTGIALIVGLISRARKTGRHLAVFGLSEHYREIFRITRLADFVTIYNDEPGVLAEK